jgi:hypothetical protein
MESLLPLYSFLLRPVGGAMWSGVSSWSGVSVSWGTVGTEAVVDQVDVTEVPIVVVVTVVVAAVLGVTSSRGAWLIVGVTVGADHERIVIFVVESIVATPTCQSQCQCYYYVQQKDKR